MPRAITAEEKQTKGVFRTYVDMYELVSGLAQAKAERERANAMESQSSAAKAKAQHDRANRKAVKQLERVGGAKELSAKAQARCEAAAKVRQALHTKHQTLRQSERRRGGGACVSACRLTDCVLTDCVGQRVVVLMASPADARGGRGGGGEC